MEINDDVWRKFKLAKFRWGCGGLTLAASQVKPQLLTHSISSREMGIGRRKWENEMGNIKAF